MAVQMYNNKRMPIPTVHKYLYLLLIEHIVLIIIQQSGNYYGYLSIIF